MRLGRVLWVLIVVAGCTRAGYRFRRDRDATDGPTPVDSASGWDQPHLDTAADCLPWDSSVDSSVVSDVPGLDTEFPDVLGPDSFVCPSVCNGGCAGGVCSINGSAAVVSCPPDLACHVSCLGEGDCPKAINCGQGPCTVTCGGAGNNNQCAAAINCAQAASCTIQCLGSYSCGAKVTCGAGPCTVVCGAPTTQGQCGSIVDCAQSCGCDVMCDGFSSCGGSMLCPVGCKQPNGKGCTSASPGCQSCP